MNRLISIISTIVFCGIFTGCDKYLDLEPSQNISENIALISDENVKHVLYPEFMVAISCVTRNFLAVTAKFNGLALILIPASYLIRLC
jgi:hypothetical protein